MHAERADDHAHERTGDVESLGAGNGDGVSRNSDRI